MTDDEPTRLQRQEKFQAENPELFPSDPEPCDDCEVGIMYFVCYDGIRRCRNCVHRLADEMGWWDWPPPRPEPTPAPKSPPPPPPMPLKVELDIPVEDDGQSTLQLTID